MQKISIENSLSLPRNRQKPKWFRSVMTSKTMFTQSQNPSTFYGFSQYRNGFIRILLGLLTNYKVKQILIWSKLGLWRHNWGKSFRFFWGGRRDFLVTKEFSGDIFCIVFRKFFHIYNNKINCRISLFLLKLESACGMNTCSASISIAVLASSNEIFRLTR